MGGHNWKAKFRFRPRSGPDEFVILDSTTLTDVRRPTSIATRYDPVYDERENVLHESVRLLHGFRGSYVLGITVWTMVDQANVARIANRLMNPFYTVALSLDPDASSPTYRDVVIAGPVASPAPLGGKWIAGVTYELRVAEVELRDELEEIGAGDVDGDGLTQVW